MKRLRMLVVDDSVVYRKLVRDVLLSLPFVESVNVAANGQIALDLIRQERPDALTLDLEMPEMNGLSTLRALRDRGWDVGVIVLSGWSHAGARLTTSALELGAFDFVLKPNGASPEANRAELRGQLQSRLEAWLAVRAGNPHVESPRAEPAAGSPRNRRPADVAIPADVLAIGASTGGPAALMELLPRLPADFPVPVLIAQHLPALFTQSLADSLNARCHLRVREARPGESVEVGHVYLAPGGQQMRVMRTRSGVCLCIGDRPETSCRPSVDVLFRSVAETYGDTALAAVLTGMGDDGREGSRALKARGATVLTQDEASCVVFGMPRQVIEAGCSDGTFPLDELAAQFLRHVLRPPRLVAVPPLPAVASSAAQRPKITST